MLSIQHFLSPQFSSFSSYRKRQWTKEWKKEWGKSWVNRKIFVKISQNHQDFLQNISIRWDEMSWIVEYRWQKGKRQRKIKFYTNWRRLHYKSHNLFTFFLFPLWCGAFHHYNDDDSLNKFEYYEEKSILRASFLLHLGKHMVPCM